MIIILNNTAIIFKKSENFPNKLLSFTDKSAYEIDLPLMFSLIIANVFIYFYLIRSMSMKKLTLSCFSLLVAAGLAHAGTPCNGFEVKIKNNTPDDLLVTKLQLAGGDFQPNSLEVISAHSEQVFTVNNSADNAKLNGVMEFNSFSLPSKRASIKFDLKNKHLICHHNVKEASGDYQISHSRVPGKVKYTIG